MSAIAGLYRLDGRPVPPVELEGMLGALAHRGPHGRNAWQDGTAGLVHAMLWTTAESQQEHLPWVHPSNLLVITADARLDNRGELVALLSLADAENLGDSAIILAAYDRWGDQCPEKLLGDFAFAIWDNSKKILFCARDHLGVKPFYYYHRPNGLFAFASEIKALLTLSDMPRRLNELRIADYLTGNLEDKAITSYRDILRLPPAHCLTINRSGARMREYWALDPGRDIHLASDDEYSQAFREIFVEAVRCRLRSVYPVGSLLSGGMDSSSVTCTARSLLVERNLPALQTFSAVFDTVPECDERSYIQAVLAAGGYEPYFLPADQLSPLTDWERVFWHTDEAFFAPNLFMQWGLARLAHDQGVRVLLEGLDGDTTVSHGFAYLTELARNGHWIKTLAEIRALSRRFHQSPWFYFRKRVVRAAPPTFVWNTWRALRRRDEVMQASGRIIRPDFARRVGLADRLATSSEAVPPHTERQDHAQRLMGGLIPFFLELGDKVGAAFEVESRYPFFDKCLVEFCFALPAEQKLRDGWTRLVLRHAMQDILPPEIQWRGGKSDLSANFNQGFSGADRHLVEEVLSIDNQLIASYVDLPALRQIYQRYTSRGNNQDGMTVWRAVSLALWLRHSGLVP